MPVGVRFLHGQLIDFDRLPTYLLLRVFQSLSLGYCNDIYNDSLALPFIVFVLHSL